MNMEYATYKYLDVSTCHITKEDNEILQNTLIDVPGLVVYPVDHGYFMPLCEHYEGIEAERAKSALSPSFWKIVDMARKRGCALIRLDADGMDHFHDLDRHDW